LSLEGCRDFVAVVLRELAYFHPSLERAQPLAVLLVPRGRAPIARGHILEYSRRL
jgi:hypothetical protein